MLMTLLCADTDLINMLEKLPCVALYLYCMSFNCIIGLYRFKLLLLKCFVNIVQVQLFTSHSF